MEGTWKRLGADTATRNVVGWATVDHLRTRMVADALQGAVRTPSEHDMRRALPGLLRRVCTEVSDGGFGPDSRLASLRRTNRAPGRFTDWPCAVRKRTGSGRDTPPSWTFLTYDGCTITSYLSTIAIAIANPVLVHDDAGWKPAWGQEPHDAVHHAMPIRRRPSIWANGGVVWDDVLAEDPHEGEASDGGEAVYERPSPGGRTAPSSSSTACAGPSSASRPDETPNRAPASWTA
ncbi:hypothetical protein [Yinghuangia soli]|uniref:Uncharacterized protein n=1 Tax=Yinghuangia soli TaxID=2908204 RepID=A0AA41TZ31_9ACTN|nr:hypothetical protein [Yinghuangia soli]MCF2527071.1 hypothetical protein [Yinghuangia soli]